RGFGSALRRWPWSAFSSLPPSGRRPGGDPPCCSSRSSVSWRTFSSPGASSPREKLAGHGPNPDRARAGHTIGSVPVVRARRPDYTRSHASRRGHRLPGLARSAAGRRDARRRPDRRRSGSSGLRWRWTSRSPTGSSPPPARSASGSTSSARSSRRSSSAVEVALQAPTGSNSQGWHFVVVTDAEKRAGLAALYRRAFHAYLSQQVPGRPQLPPDDPRARQLPRILDSATYLAEHLHEVPVHVLPCVEGRVENAGPLAQASV